MKFKRISDNYIYLQHNSYDVKCLTCGWEKRVRASVNVSDISKCKRCNTIYMNKNIRNKHRGVGVISRRFYSYFKSGAKRRGVEFNISIEYLNNLAVEQNYRCALSNLDIIFPQHTNPNKGYNFETNINQASLDRIDSNKPYIEGNVQWVHKSINIMKNGFPQNEFIWFCHKIASCHDNPELSSLKGNRKKVREKVQRLDCEDIPTNNQSTSAEHPIDTDDDIV